MTMPMSGWVIPEFSGNDPTVNQYTPEELAELRRRAATNANAPDRTTMLGMLNPYKIMGQDEYDPTAPQLDQTAANEDLARGLASRYRQHWLSNRLQNQVMGRGPTVAGQQMQFGIGKAMANAGRMAANARGTNRALAQRSATYAGADMQQQANRDAALMRAQEQLSAQNQYGALETAVRHGDSVDRATSLDAAKANQESQMQEQRLQTEISEGNAKRSQVGQGALLAGAGGAIRGAMGSDIRMKESITPLDRSFAVQVRQGLPTDNDEQMTVADYNRSYLDSIDARRGAESAAHQRQQSELSMDQDAASPISDPGQGGILGAVGGGLEGMGNTLMQSDRHSKERIRQLEMELYGGPLRELDKENPYAEKVKRPLAPVHAYGFRYRPQFAMALAEKEAATAPPGLQDEVRGEVYADARAPRPGVMTQELLKSRSPAVKSMVKKTPAGQAIDMRRGLSVALAQQAQLDKRLARLENRGR